MQKIPTISTKQYSSIEKLEPIYNNKGNGLIKEANNYPDKLALFLKNWMDELKNKSSDKNI